MHNYQIYIIQNEFDQIAGSEMVWRNLRSRGSGSRAAAYQGIMALG